MKRPSGVQVGLLSSRKSSLVTAFASPPVAGTTQMLSPPPRSDVKATHLPSGENVGCMSHAMPEVSDDAVPPAIGIV